jgi:uncharacterized RDD family membrane protein YckC
MENRVGFWRRVAATLLDMVILAVLAALTRGLFSSMFAEAIDAKVTEQLSSAPAGAAAKSRDMMMGLMSWSVAWMVLGLVYALIEAFTGYSPGKLILGIRAVDESGQRAPVGKLLLRFAIKYSGSILGVAGLLLMLPMLDKVSMFVSLGIVVGFFLVLTPARQALHDKVAGTAVLRKSDIGVQAQQAASPAVV